MTVLEILQRRLDPVQLKGFKKGLFDETGEKLFAYTILSTKDEDFDWLYLQFLRDRGYSHSSSPEDEEKYKIYNPDGTYSYKGVEQLVEEKIFKFTSLLFYGTQFQGEWFIFYEHSFGETEKEMAKENDRIISMGFFKSSVFHPVSETMESPDFYKLTKMISEKLSKKLDWPKDMSIIRENMDLIPSNERPKRVEKQYANLREFIGQPWLVAHLKQEEKSKVNRLFESYFNESVLLPFLKKLRIERFNDFISLHPLYSPDYFPLIYPHSKEYVMAIVKAINVQEKSRLHYFVYQTSTKRMFEWVKPTVHEVPGHHTEWILEDIKDFSSWGEEFDFHEPSITMEDATFWNEHVFKKENGRYLYLEELMIPYTPL